MFQNSLLYSNHELKRLRRLHFRIESSNQVASRRCCHYPTLYQGSNTSTIFDRPYSLLRNQRCRREDGKKKLIRTTSRTVNLLLAPSFFSLSLSLGIYPLGLHCVYLRKLARPRAATFLPTVWAGCNDYRSSCASRNRCPRQNRSPSFLSSLSRFEEGSNNEESRDTQKRWRPRRLEEFK